RQDHKLVVLLQVPERSSGIGEGRPVAHRAAVIDALLPANRDAPVLGEPFVNYGEKFVVALRGRHQLLRRFMPRVRLQHLVARELSASLRDERLQSLDYAALPIDERAIAVEGESFEICQSHAKPNGAL